MEVYLDNSATTRCFDEVAALMTQIMCEDYGNPSSLHRKGVQAEQYIRYAKDVIFYIGRNRSRQSCDSGLRLRKLPQRQTSDYHAD